MMDVKRLIAGTIFGTLSAYSLFAIFFWGLGPHNLLIFSFISVVLAVLLWN